MKRRDIIVYYLKTWFLIDLLASFPYSWFINLDDVDDQASDGISAFRSP